MRVLVTGRPGAGKGTQCATVAARLGIAHVSTGELLREAVQAETPLGMEARDHLAAGRLVPDGLVLQLVESRLGHDDIAERGFLLDGFPRTIGQADALFDLLAPSQLDLVVELVVPAVVVMQRLAARGRDDDRVAVLECRLHLYERQTAPMLRWLRTMVPVVRVDGDRQTHVVTAEVLEHVGARSAAQTISVERV